MKLSFVFMILCSFIHFNYGCKIALAPLVAQMEADIKLVDNAIVQESAIVKKINSYQNGAQATTPAGVFQLPLAANQTANTVYALSTLLTSFIEYIGNQCDQSNSQISGPSITINTQQIQPYINAFGTVSSNLDKAVASIHNLGETGYKAIVPVLKNTQVLLGNYNFPSEAINDMINDCNNVGNALNAIATALLNAETQSQSVQAPNDSTTANLVVGAINKFMVSVATLFKAQDQAIKGITPNLPVTVINSNTVQVNVQSIEITTDTVLNGIETLLKKIQGLLSEAVSGLKLLENPIISGAANIAGGLANAAGGIANDLLGGGNGGNPLGNLANTFLGGAGDTGGSGSAANANSLGAGGLSSALGGL